MFCHRDFRKNSRSSDFQSIRLFSHDCERKQVKVKTDLEEQYSCLESPMDGGAWKAEVHGVAEGRTRLSDFTFNFYFHALEKEMATHSNILAWRRGAWWASVYGVA